MFQNPLKPQEFENKDPFNEMGSANVGNQPEKLNPFTSMQNEKGESNIHFVNPHQVEGHYRQDGTYVESYWRDGDGNTSNDLNVEDGGGYLQTNPDGIIFNNFGF